MLYVFFELVSPQLYHPFGMFLFCRIILRFPDTFVFQFVRKELLFHKISFRSRRRSIIRWDCAVPCWSAAG